MSSRCFLLAAAMLLPLVAASQVDLESLYPPLAEDQFNDKIPWTHTEDDLFLLDQFHLSLGDDLVLSVSEAELCLGRSDAGAVWAAIVPQASATLISSATTASEELTSLWLRFHPSQVNELFPPETVRVHDATPALWRFTRIIGHKFRSSYHYSHLALIPPANSMILDVDTYSAIRRYLVINSDDQSASYLSSFEERAIPKEIPITDFDAEVSINRVWMAYNRDYPGFVLRPEIDWEAMREDYFDRALACKTAYEFGALIAEMLAHFRDLHIRVSLNDERIPVYQVDTFVNANPRAVPAMIGNTTRVEGTPIRWGITDDGIGYLGIHSWTGEQIPHHVHQIFESMRDTHGMIVDVRTNGGGNEGLALQVAQRFIQSATVYSYSQYRKGFDHNDLTEPQPRSVSPSQWWLYTRPVLLLTGQACGSSNESFIAMMNTSDQVTSMGDRTRGTSGNPKSIMTPVGVEFTLPTWLDLLADMEPLDERGIAPDILFEATEAAFRDGRDDLLEAALERARLWPAVEAPLPGDPYNPLQAELQQKRANPPFVSAIKPLHGARVIPHATVSYQFNRPMDPKAFSFQWDKGGYHDVRRIAYDDEEDQFTFVFDLHPGLEHTLQSNPPRNNEPRGFHDYDHIHARPTQLVLSVSSTLDEWTEMTDVVLESIQPEPETAVSSLMTVTVEFNQPMFALIPSLVVDEAHEDDIRVCPLVEYNEARTRCTVPVWIAPGEEVSFILDGFISELGAEADPVELTYEAKPSPASNANPFDRDLRIDELLQRFQQARENIHAAQVDVTLQESTGWKPTGYSRLQSKRASFAWDGDTRWFADISSFMGIPYQMGADGTHVWKSMLNEYHYFWERFPLNKLDDFDYLWMTPLSLFTPVSSIQKLEWLEPRVVEGKQCAGVRAWMVETLGRDSILIAQEYWFDPETDLLHVCRVVTSNYTEAIYVFDVQQTNEDVPTAIFTPAFPVAVEPVNALLLMQKEDRRFVSILDGSDGQLRVRWGTSGPNRRTSEGLN